MRTKYFTTLAAATLLTIASSAAAFAEAADVNSVYNQDQITDTNQAASVPTQNNVPNVGWSAHVHPHGHRYP